MDLIIADFKVLWIVVGGHRHMSEAQISNESELKDCLADGIIGLPPVDCIPNDDRDMPYFFLTDNGVWDVNETTHGA